MKGSKISDNLVVVIAVGCITLLCMAGIVGSVVSEKNAYELEITEEQPFTPLTYHVIECNVAGTDQTDYVIEIGTRDPEEVGRIIRLLEGGE